MSTIDDLWFFAKGEQGGRPVLIRARQNLDEVVGNVSHPKLFRIIWEYDPDDDSGLPSQELNARMAHFEGAVFNALEQNALCIFFCVYVHNGSKEWSAYTSNVQETCDRFNAALEGRHPYPVQLAIDDDLDWQEYRNLMTATGMSGRQ